MAGGEGSRLRPLTVGRPKPMVPIANKSVIGHIFDLLKHHGLTDILVTLRYMASSVEDFFEDGSSLGLSIRYSVEDKPLGTAGSVRYCADQLGDDTFLVISGDALTDVDLSEVVRVHKARGAAATLVLARVTNPLEYGVIVTDDEDHITQFLEKPGWNEVISDTVNTGIYVLEPHVLARIPKDQFFDFSKDLFPLLLEAGEPLYGHITEGYWCDVGNVEEYARATGDLLYGHVHLSQPIGEHIGGGVWVGRDVEIAPSAQLFGPIYLGNEVKIKGDVVVHGPAVIRDYTIVDAHTRIERSIVWRNSYIGESCELRGAILGRQCTVKSHVSAFEGVVVGESCVLGEGSTIYANVKLWPRKEVEPGATVKESIIWGNRGRRELFNRFGVSGVVNVDLTPEFAAKVSAALGATLEKGSYVAVNRDVHRTSRMLKRALISGLPGAGIHVWDVGTVPIPVLRHFVHHREDTSAGINVRLSPFDQRVVDIRFIDECGLNYSQPTERSVERAYFREDFRRAYLDEIGIINYAPDSVQAYMRDFLGHVDADLIRGAGFQLVIDYSHGQAAEPLADILTQLGVDVVPLNARVSEAKLAVLEREFEANRQRVATIVSALGADLGVQLDVGGEKLFLIDSQGRVLDGRTAAALLTELALYANPGRNVAVPSTLPNAFDTIAGWHGGHARRIRGNAHGMMSAAQQGEELLVVDGDGNFIFPDFHPAIDGMMATVRLLEYLARRALPLAQVVDYLPSIHVATGQASCAWNQKGRVMRVLNRELQDRQVEKVDGLKLHLGASELSGQAGSQADNEWVHIAPNLDKPQFDIIAEAASDERAQALVAEYCQRVLDIVQSG